MAFEMILVRDIAIERPGATGVFRRHGIELGRHGDVPLARAAESAGAELGRVARELDALPPTKRGVPAEPERLIAHILERYHEVHRREFPEAIQMARRVETAHRGRADCPHGIADLLAAMFDDLESHQQKEERMLFPMMRAGGRKMTGLPIGRMLIEHDQVGRQLEQLARLTAEFTPPEDACTTWRSLYGACRKLDEDLREHMRLENDVLFPQYGAAAPPTAGAPDPGRG